MIVHNSTDCNHPPPLGQWTVGSVSSTKGAPPLCGVSRERASHRMCGPRTECHGTAAADGGGTGSHAPW